jgi:Flp pilus assembly protein TadD
MANEAIWRPFGERQAALAEAEARLAADPADLPSLFARANLLAELGRTEAARDAYLAFLALDHGHESALNNLGALLH